MYMQTNTHISTYIACSVSRVSSEAARLLIANPATHKKSYSLRVAGCINTIIMKFETTSSAAEYECEFPDSSATATSANMLTS